MKRLDTDFDTMGLEFSPIPKSPDYELLFTKKRYKNNTPTPLPDKVTPIITKKKSIKILTPESIKASKKRERSVVLMAKMTSPGGKQEMIPIKQRIISKEEELPGTIPLVFSKSDLSHVTPQSEKRLKQHEILTPGKHSAKKSDVKRSDEKDQRRDLRMFLASKNINIEEINVEKLLEAGLNPAAFLTKGSAICSYIVNGELKFLKSLGKGANGEAFELAFPNMKGEYAVKRLMKPTYERCEPIEGYTSNGNSQYITLPKGSIACSEAISEYCISVLASARAQKDGNKNFMDTIYFGTCSNFGRKAQYVFMEKVDTSLLKLTREKLLREVLNSLYIQIVCAIVTYQKLGIVHGDLHMGNIFISKFHRVIGSKKLVKDKKYPGMEYKINTVSQGTFSIYTPYCPYVAKIGDWGMAVKYGTWEDDYKLVGNRNVIDGRFGRTVPNFYNTSYDLAYITLMFFRQDNDNLFIKEIINWIIGKNDPKVIYTISDNPGTDGRPNAPFLNTLLGHVSPMNILTNKKLMGPYLTKMTTETVLMGNI